MEAADYILKIGTPASPFIALIPVAGPVISEIRQIADIVSVVIKEGTKSDPTPTLLDELKKSRGSVWQIPCRAEMGHTNKI